jgi:NADH-quinone oxidoreductase subunit N
MLDVNVLQALQDSVLRDCEAFLPELILSAGIVLLLLLRMFSRLDRLHLGWVALLIGGGALAASYAQWAGCCLTSPGKFFSDQGTSEIFGGMLVYDYFTVFLRFFLAAFALLVFWLTMLTGIPDKEDSADFYTLVLGATLGMMVMASTNHLLMMFIGIEMASLPSYALAGYLKGRRESSEAALKYVVYGGGAAGVMLYGISLLAGKFGTAYLPELASAYASSLSAGGFDPILVLGTLFILIGIAFKLAAVPFHFWCPDVFEGASAEVAGFLSVASKGAAVALLARIAIALGGMGTLAGGTTVPVPKVADYLVPALAFLGIITATFGNLAAFRQTNLKRLLAYSTIAHAGYMIMAIATLDRLGIKAVLVYLAAYLLMNLGAFAVVAFLRNETGSEDLADFRGLVRRSPWMTVALSIFLLSLLGVPPLVGFVAKIEIFMALWQSAKEYAAVNATALATWLYAAFAFLGLNSVLSAVYYLKVMKVMILEEKAEDVEGKPARELPEPVLARGYALLLSLVVLVGIFAWSPVEKASVKGSYAETRESKTAARAEAGRGEQKP